MGGAAWAQMWPYRPWQLTQVIQILFMRQPGAECSRVQMPAAAGATLGCRTRPPWRLTLSTQQLSTPGRFHPASYTAREVNSFSRAPTAAQPGIIRAAQLTLTLVCW